MTAISETLYRRLAGLSYRLKDGWRMKNLEEPRPILARCLALAIDDITDYFGMSVEDVFACAEKWRTLEESLFAQSQSASAFYEGWKGEYARHNICANVINQLTDSMNPKVLYHLVSPAVSSRGVLVDYGCGTAALSLGLAVEGVLTSQITLADVKNDVLAFVAFRVKKRKLGHMVACRDLSELDGTTRCDAVLCVDVLEHLEESSATLLSRIHPLLKVGGVLYLRAPWRGQVTHLDAAADDFYSHGGRELLRDKYRVERRVQPLDIACLYRKLAD
jgi:SAM-dependent methyltransferase